MPKKEYVNPAQIFYQDSNKLLSMSGYHIPTMDDTDRRAKEYAKIPSSTEYIPRRGKEPRSLDLRALDEQAKREMAQQGRKQSERSPTARPNNSIVGSILSKLAKIFGK